MSPQIFRKYSHFVLRRFSKQNCVIRLKSNILPPLPIFGSPQIFGLAASLLDRPLVAYFKASVRSDQKLKSVYQLSGACSTKCTKTGFTLVQLVELTPPKRVRRVRFPAGSYRRLEKRYLRPAQPCGCAQRWWVGARGLMVRARCCRWFATNAAFTGKAAVWTPGASSGDGLRTS